MPAIDKFLEVVHKNQGSDLHVVAGVPIKIRIHGQLEPMSRGAKGKGPLTQDEAEKLLFPVLSDAQRIRFLEKHDIDLAYEVPGMARFRTNLFYHRNGVGGVFRIIPTKIQSVEELNVPHVVEEFAHMKSGLVLVTGPTGSGKSTTLAAVLDYINRNFSKHIITIEDPIEFVHQNKRSIITQREIHHDAKSFARALRAAMREDPDVILVGEMRDLDTISRAITLAEMGKLVFATLHTNHAAKTIDRIIDVFPHEQQPQIRTMLSISLKGVISQLLCRRKQGGRIPVNEVLRWTTGLANIIREGKIEKIQSVIEGGRGEGMQKMDDCIWDRWERGEIAGHEAYMKSLDKRRFEHLEDEE
ncbi:MAG: type IV pilus twitching motility protein PilT [Planctomycetota bacterium]|nr:MAG: type IV pilus twitching motility protein PilT [Planctomycetota bacterium]